MSCCFARPRDAASMKRSSIVLILCVCATVARGGVIVSAPGSGWAESAWDGSGASHSFLLDYDPSRPERAIRAIDGQETELLNPISLFSDISISNATLSVEGFIAGSDDFAAGYGEAAKPQYIHINNSDGQLSDMDFVLEGTLYIDWAGAVSSRDEMVMQMKMTQIPEPASILLVAMVSGLGLFIRRKFGS